MSDNKGYVIKHRSIYDWYKSVAEMDIYALAIYDYLATFVRKDKIVYKGIQLEAGQLIRSYGQIADALKIARSTVIRRMTILKKVGAISIDPIDAGNAVVNVITVKDFTDHDNSDDHDAKDDSTQDIDLDKLVEDLDK